MNRSAHFLLLLCLSVLLCVASTAHAQDCRPIPSSLKVDDTDLLAWQTWHRDGMCGQGIVIGVLTPDFPVQAQVNDMVSKERLILHPEQRADWNATTSSTRTTELMLTLNAAAPNAKILLFRVEFRARNPDGFREANEWFSAEGVNIVANLIAYPGFTDDDVAQIRSLMSSAAETGILWLNTAGNFGRSFYEGQLDDTGWDREGWHYFVGTGNGLLPIYPVRPGTVEVYVSWTDTEASLILGAFVDTSARIPYPGAEDGYNPSLASQRGYLRFEATSSEPFYLAVLDQLHARVDESTQFRLFAVNGVLDETVRTDGNSIPLPNELVDTLTIGASDIEGQPLASSRDPALGKPELLANGRSLLAGSGEWGSGFALMRVAGTGAIVWSQDLAQSIPSVRQTLLNMQIDGMFVPTSANSHFSLPLLIGIAACIVLVVVYCFFRLRSAPSKSRTNTILQRPTSPVVKPLVFISYSSKDRDFVLNLCKEVKWKLKAYDVWIDIERIQAGHDWSDEINRGLDAASAMLFIATPNSVTSDQVKSEWNYFLNTRNMPLLTLRNGVDFKDLPFHIHRLHVLTYDPKRRAHIVREVVEALERIAQSQASTSP